LTTARKRQTLARIDRTFLSAAERFTLATELPETFYAQLLRAIALTVTLGEHLPLTVPKCLVLVDTNNRKSILTRKEGGFLHPLKQVVSAAENL
jgi:hypothetical protein